MLREIDAEEHAAVGVERRIRSSAAASHVVAAAEAPVRPAVAAAAAPPAPSVRPMTAASDRPLDMVSPVPPLDMERLRQVLARDLMRQIRAEMERGG